MKSKTGSPTIEANTWEAFEREVLGAKVPVIVDFWAPWCAPCRMVAPEIDAIARAKGDAIRVVKVNVDKNRDAAYKYQIASIPTVALFQGGELLHSSIGAKPRRMLEADLKL